MSDEYTRSILCADNYDLFDKVRDRLNIRPPEPIQSIAFDLGVTVDDLCRWVIGFKESKRPKYQSAKLAPIAQPRTKAVTIWADDEDRRRQRIAQKARDGARATILALEKAG
jgi:hypothetical protein